MNTEHSDRDTRPASPPADSAVERAGTHPLGAAIGAVGGAVTGAVVGIAAGPVGSLAGAVGGAARGAARGRGRSATHAPGPVTGSGAAGAAPEGEDEDAKAGPAGEGPVKPPTAP